ncbi:MAG: deoxyribose-phosphate aldolase [Bryobacteraceae bacterium]
MDTNRPPLATYADMAQLFDHSLVRPELTEDQIRDGCDLAAEYGVATVSVRPSDIDIAIRQLRGTNVRVGSLAGFPHGSQNTATKLYEVRDLIRRGAKEIDMVINIGKLVSRQWHYCETELVQMANACHAEGVILKCIVETAYLDHEQKIVACKLMKHAQVDYIKTSTGIAPTGYTREDVALFYSKCHPFVKVKAAHGVRTMERAIEAYEAGADRIGVTATKTMLDAWKAELKRRAESGEPAPAAATATEGSGY